MNITKSTCNPTPPPPPPEGEVGLLPISYNGLYREAPLERYRAGAIYKRVSIENGEKTAITLPFKFPKASS